MLISILFLYKCQIPGKEVLNYLDVLVDGQYVDELCNPKLDWRGSENQRVIDVQKSLQQKQIVKLS